MLIDIKPYFAFLRIYSYESYQRAFFCEMADSVKSYYVTTISKIILEEVSNMSKILMEINHENHSSTEPEKARQFLCTAAMKTLIL